MLTDYLVHRNVSLRANNPPRPKSDGHKINTPLDRVEVRAPCKVQNTQNYNSVCCIMWIWNLVKGRTQASACLGTRYLKECLDQRQMKWRNRNKSCVTCRLYQTLLQRWIQERQNGCGKKDIGNVYRILAGESVGERPPVTPLLRWGINKTYSSETGCKDVKWL